MKFIVGDSHANFFDQAGIMKSHWLGPIHAATAYQLLRVNPDLLRLREALAMSEHYVNVGVPTWQSTSGVYETPNIAAGDVVLFSYGFNDVQKNIYKYARGRHEEEIRGLFSRYLGLLKDYESKYKVTCVVCSIPPNPAECVKGSTGEFDYGISGEFSAEGSNEERDQYTRYANKVLEELCPVYGFRFLDLYAGLSDQDGFMKREFTVDYVHLTHTNEELVYRMKTMINNL